MAVRTDNPNMGRPVSNKHKVPAKQWKRWSNTAKRVFNKTYEGMKNQSLFLPPNATMNSAKAWHVTRWNAAWTAADAASGISENHLRAA